MLKKTIFLKKNNVKKCNNLRFTPGERSNAYPQHNLGKRVWQAKNFSGG